jgi:hypothetical protein
MTSYIVDCLILNINFYNTYLVFLHIKNMKKQI